MKKDWPTKARDLHIARVILEEYATRHQTESLGLFELVFNPKKKRLDFQFSDWVQMLAHQFNAMYGDHQGDYVTRQVVSQYMTQGHSIH